MPIFELFICGLLLLCYNQKNKTFHSDVKSEPRSRRLGRLSVLQTSEPKRRGRYSDCRVAMAKMPIKNKNQSQNRQLLRLAFIFFIYYSKANPHLFLRQGFGGQADPLYLGRGGESDT